MKKKLLSALLICSALLTACGGSATTEEGSSPAQSASAESSSSHVHIPSPEWVCDFDSHWRICDCGEEMVRAPHNLEEVNCTVCGSELVTFGDGTRQITAYTRYGDCSQFISYDSDGNPTIDERYDYVYDGAGNMSSMNAYSNGFHYASYEYTLGSDGSVYMSSHTSYYEDGSYQLDTYNENFNTLRTVAFDATEKIENDHRFTYSEDGSLMSEDAYQDGVLLYEQECRLSNEGCWDITYERSYGEDGSLAYTYDDSGNPLSEIRYKPDGSVDVEYAYENVYDLAGNLILKRTFTNGALTQEMEYIFGSDADGSWSRSGKTIDYHADGGKTIYDEDPKGTWSTNITYNADGKVVQELRYEYLFNENGDSIGSKGYDNGRLFTEYMAILDDAGNSIGIRNIDYREDGSKIVREYDDSFDLVREITYDPSGTAVES